MIVVLAAAGGGAGLVGCGAAEDTAEPAQPEAVARAGDYLVPGSRVFPEGIAVQESTGAVFVGSTTDGAIFRASGPGAPMRPWLRGGIEGRTSATGLKADERGRLWIAGRTTGRVSVHDIADRRLIRTLRAPGSGRTLVNDIAVSDAAAYVTDSHRPVLYRARLDRGRVGDLEAWLDLAATPIPTDAGFNLNGIAASAGGRHLVTVHFDSGRLFRIDTRTRAVREVDLDGARLRTGDGLVLDGQDLLVVRESPGDVVPVRLAPDLLSGRLGTPFGRGRLDFPTTAAIRGDRVLVVNSQLDRAPDRATPPFTVSALPRPTSRDAGRAPGG